MGIYCGIFVIMGNYNIVSEIFVRSRNGYNSACGGKNICAGSRRNVNSFVTGS